jgi:CRP-like cAMP-binding protein
MDQRKVKEKATEAFSKGKFAKAAELYGEYCQQDPKDLQARLRMGDAWAKARQKDKAIAAYRAAAEGYARDGFLPRAIAASKLILELDPAHKEVQGMLAQLYARRTAGEGKAKPTTAERKAAPLAALPGGDVPSPMNRADAIELPKEEAVALTADMRVARPASPEVPAPDGAPEQRRAPIEIELDTAGADEAPLELDLPGARTAPPQNGAAGPAQALEGAQAGVAPSQDGGERVFDLSDELPAELELAAPAPPPPPPEAVEVPPGLATRDLNSDWEIVGEEPSSAPAPPPAPEPAPAPAPDPEPIPLTTVKRAAPPSEPSSGPELKPSGRIWVPSGMVATEPAPAAAPGVPSSAAGWSQPSAAPPAAASDLQAGLQALSRFDELDVDDAALGFTPAPSPVAIAVAAAQQPTRAPATSMPSFTELELEGDSLLHAVEAAARAGLAQAGATAAAEESIPIEVQEPSSPGALPKIPLFSDLSPDAFIELFERCPLRRATSGERIIEQGSIGDSFFVICAGSVKVYRVDNGHRHDITTLDEGAFFGEVALLSDAPRTASVEAAAEDTQLLEISAPVLAQLSHRYPQVAQALKKFCRQRLLSNLMSSSALFRPFNKKDRRELIEKFRAREVQRGDVIIREGDRSDGLYIVLSGEAEVKRGDRALAHLKEGEIFGEMSLLQKTPASATVSAAKRTSLLRLPRQDFDAVVLSHPQILVLTDDRKRQNDALLGGVAQVGDEGLLLV